MWVLYTDYRYHWDARTVGLMLALMGVLGAITSATLVGPIVRALGERAALLFGLACGAIGFTCYGLAPTGILFAAGIPFIAGWFVSGPAAQTLLTRRVDPREQGRLQGAVASVQGVASVIAPGLFTGVFAAAIDDSAGIHAARRIVPARRRAAAGERGDRLARDARLARSARGDAVQDAQKRVFGLARLITAMNTLRIRSSGTADLARRRASRGAARKIRLWLPSDSERIGAGKRSKPGAECRSKRPPSSRISVSPPQLGSQSSFVFK